MIDMHAMNCLECGTLVDAATAISSDVGPVPCPNDITVCLYCGHVMAFDADLKMRELTDAEMLEVAGNKTILAVQKLRGLVLKEKDDARKNHSPGRFEA